MMCALDVLALEWVDPAIQVPQNLVTEKIRRIAQGAEFPEVQAAPIAPIGGSMGRLLELGAITYG
jgi:hypothetical protein